MTDEEKTKKIAEMMAKYAQLFIDEIPKEIMETNEGSSLMYSTALNLLYRVAKATGTSQEKTFRDLESIFEFNKQQNLN